MDSIYNTNIKKGRRFIISFHPDDFRGQYSDKEILRRIIRIEEFLVEYIHNPYDPPGINRVYITAGKLRVELLPSKGMSVGTVLYGNIMLLWQPLLDSLPDPDYVDLKGDLIWNGEPVWGFRFIEYLVGGVMMFGLENWGMPFKDHETGISGTLHGEVSNIQIERVWVSAGKESLEVSGEFFVHDGRGDIDKVWFRRGERIYRVKKRVIVYKKKSIIAISDTIVNISGQTQNPDWGYSIKFKPYDGTEYLVPSKKISLRTGGVPDRDHEVWHPATIESVREERGIIHKGLLVKEELLNGKGVETLIKHKNGNGVRAVVPQTPYFLSWFSSGGKGSREFMLPGHTGTGPLKVFENSWNGIGPEFGVSALDHDGDVDPFVERSSLESGESVKVDFFFQPISGAAVRNIENEIRSYNSMRTNDCIG